MLKGSVGGTRLDHERHQTGYEAPDGASEQQADDGAEGDRCGSVHDESFRWMISYKRVFYPREAKTKSGVFSAGI